MSAHHAMERHCCCTLTPGHPLVAAALVIEIETSSSLDASWLSVGTCDARKRGHVSPVVPKTCQHDEQCRCTFPSWKGNSTIERSQSQGRMQKENEKKKMGWKSE